MPLVFGQVLNFFDFVLFFFIFVVLEFVYWKFFALCFCGDFCGLMLVFLLSGTIGGLYLV